MSAQTWESVLAKADRIADTLRPGDADVRELLRGMLEIARALGPGR